MPRGEHERERHGPGRRDGRERPGSPRGARVEGGRHGEQKGAANAFSFDRRATARHPAETRAQRSRRAGSAARGREPREESGRHERERE